MSRKPNLNSQPVVLNWIFLVEDRKNLEKRGITGIAIEGIEELRMDHVKCRIKFIICI